MAAKRSSAKGPSRARTRTASTGDDLGQLRATIAEIRARIESEARKRGIKFPSFEQTARAPKRFVAEINALSKKGRQLRSSLKRALGNPDPWRLRDQARSMLGAMKTELEQRTSEIKDKGEQLNELIRHSARQALHILQSKSRSSKRRSSSRAGS
jgi:HAMP domain-containing protein